MCSFLNTKEKVAMPPYSTSLAKKKECGETCCAISGSEKTELVFLSGFSSFLRRSHMLFKIPKESLLQLSIQQTLRNWIIPRVRFFASLSFAPSYTYIKLRLCGTKQNSPKTYT